MAKNTEFHTKVTASKVFEQLMCQLSPGCHLLPGVIESSVKPDKENWRITFCSKGPPEEPVTDEEDEPQPEAKAKKQELKWFYSITEVII